MKPSDLTIELSKTIEHLDNMTVSDEFRTDAALSNEVSALVHDTNRAIARLCMMQHLSTYANKNVALSKQAVEELLKRLDIASDVQDGQTVIVFEDNQFSLSKRRNKSSESVSFKDFVLELQKLGVDQKLIDKAAKKSTKARAGALFYTVEARNVE